MLISETTQIKTPIEKIWNLLSSLKGVEKYFSIVSKSVVEGSGEGAKRICLVNMGNQVFDIKETLQFLDNSDHSFILSIDYGPIQMKGMKIRFDLQSQGENVTDVIISTEVGNPDAGALARNYFTMIGQGLKKYYEL